MKNICMVLIDASFTKTIMINTFIDIKPDTPLHNISEDVFGRDYLAKLIANSIINLSRNDHDSTCIAIYGKWGQGKTSLLNFVKEIKLMSIYDAILQDKTMLRISIRFINEFHFDNFDDPTEYVKTLISSTTDIIYPVSKYSYKLVCDLSRDAFSNVNHSLNKVGDEYSYIFDIDVLKRVNLLYDKDTVSDTLNELRVFKNNLFFGNLTDKTIELCK